MALPVPMVTKLATGATVALSALMLAVALSVLAMGHLLRPVLQWETQALARLVGNQPLPGMVADTSKGTTHHAAD